MKILVYLAREDERKLFLEYGVKYNYEIHFEQNDLCEDTVEKANGYDAVSCVASSDLSEKILIKLHIYGVRILSLRTAGYDNLDINAAKRLDFSISNVQYSPYSVSNFTILMMLMLVRKIKYIFNKSFGSDYRLEELQGQEIQNLTVGIIGAGNIGKAVINNLKGFGCKIIYYDIAKTCVSGADRVDFDSLLQTADVISLHIPLEKNTYHIIGRNEFQKMKTGAILINTARGELVDTEQLICALREGRISAAGLDCLENENTYFRKKLGYNNCDVSEEYAILSTFQNVIITPHLAFYTDQSVDDMVKISLENIHQSSENRKDIHDFI